MMPKLIAAYYHVKKIVNISKLSLSYHCILLAFHSITNKEQFSRVIRPTEKATYITKKLLDLRLVQNPEFHVQFYLRN